MTQNPHKRFVLRKKLWTGLFVAIAAVMMLTPREGAAQEAGFLQPTPIYAPYFEFEFPDNWITNPPAQPPVDMWTSEVSRTWCRLPAVEDEALFYGVSLGDDCTDYVTPMRGGVGPFAGMPDNQTLSPHHLIDVPFMYSPYCGLDVASLTPQNPAELGLGWDFDLQDNYTYTGCWGVDEPVAVPFVNRDPANPQAINVMLADSGSDWRNDSHDQVGFLGTAGDDSMDPVNMSFELDVFPATEEGYLPISVASGYFYTPPPANAVTAAGTPTTGLFQDQLLAWMKSPVAYRAWRKMIQPPDTVILSRGANNTEPGDPHATMGYVTFIKGQGMDVHDDCIKNSLSACTAECGGSLANPQCASCLAANPSEADALNNCPRHIVYNETDRSRTFQLDGTSDPVFIGYIPNTMNRWYDPLGPFCQADCIPGDYTAFCATANCGDVFDDGCGNQIPCGPCPPGPCTPTKDCADECNNLPCGAQCDDGCGNQEDCPACIAADPCANFVCGPGETNCGQSCIDLDGNEQKCKDCGTPVLAGCTPGVCDNFVCGPGDTNCGQECEKCDGTVISCLACGASPPPPPPDPNCWTQQEAEDHCASDPTGTCGNILPTCNGSHQCDPCTPPPPPPPPPRTRAECEANCQLDSWCSQTCNYDGGSLDCPACTTTCTDSCLDECQANNCQGSCDVCGSTYACSSICPPGPGDELGDSQPDPGDESIFTCLDRQTSCAGVCDCAGCAGNNACINACESGCGSSPDPYFMCAYNAISAAGIPDCEEIPSDACPTLSGIQAEPRNCSEWCPCIDCAGTGSNCMEKCQFYCGTLENTTAADFLNCADPLNADKQGSGLECEHDYCPDQYGLQEVPPTDCNAACSCLDCDKGGSLCPSRCMEKCGTKQGTAGFYQCLLDNKTYLTGTCYLAQNAPEREFEIYMANWLDNTGELVCSEAEAAIPTTYDDTTGTGPGYTGEASTNTNDCAEMCALVGADPSLNADHEGITDSADVICTTICTEWCGTAPKPPSSPARNLAAEFPLRPEHEEDLATCLAIRGGFFTEQSLSDPSVGYVGNGYSKLEVDPKFTGTIGTWDEGYRKIALNYDPAHYQRWNPCWIYPSYKNPMSNGALPPSLQKTPHTLRHSAYCNRQHDAKLTQDASSGFQSGTFFVLNRGPISCWNDIDFRNPVTKIVSDPDAGAIVYPDGGLIPENFNMRSWPSGDVIGPDDPGDKSCGYITFYNVENTPNGLQVRPLLDGQGGLLQVPTGLNPAFATVGDYNGDGSILDIAVTNVGSQNQGENGSVSVMFCAPGPSANFKSGGSAGGPDICPCGALIVDDTPLNTLGSADNSVHPWGISSDVLMGKKVTYEDANEVIEDFNQGEFTPATGEVCNDTLDNDSDGLTDCFDPDCETFCKSVIRAPEDLVVTFLDAYKSGHNDFAVLRNAINGNGGTMKLIHPKNYVYDVRFAMDHYRDHEDLSSQYNSPEFLNKPIKLLAKDYGAYPLGVASGFFGETSDYSLLPLGTGAWLQTVIGHMVPGFTITEGGIASPCSQVMLGFHNSRNVGLYHQVFPGTIDQQWGPWNNPQQTIERCTAEFVIDPEDVTDATTPIYNAANSGLGGQGLGWGPKALRGYYSNAYTERSYRPGGTDWFYVIQSTDPLAQGQLTLNLDVEIDFSLDLMGINGNTLNLYETQYVDNSYAVAEQLPEFNAACVANDFELFNLVQDTTDITPVSNPCLSNQPAPPGFSAGPASYCSFTGEDPNTPHRCYQRWGAQNAAGYACCLLLESPGVASEIQKITDDDLWPSSSACPFVDPMDCCIDQLSQQNFSIDPDRETVFNYTYNGNVGCAPDCRDELRDLIDAAFAAQDFASQWEYTVELNCTCMPNPTFMQQGLCGPVTTFDCSTLGNATAIACCQDPNSTGCDPCSLAPDPACCRDSSACPQQTPPPCVCSDLDASVQDCCVEQAGTQTYESCNELLAQINFSECAQQLPPTTVTCESAYSGDQTRIDCCNGVTDACCDLLPTADMKACCLDSQDPACDTIKQGGPCACEGSFDDTDLRNCCAEKFGHYEIDCMDLVGWNISECLEPTPPTEIGVCDPNDANAVRAGFAKDFPECCQRYDGDLVMGLSSGDADCPGGGTDGCNIDFTNNGVINGNVQICCECFNVVGSHNDVSCTQSCATIYDPTPDPNFCMGKRALNQPLPIECTATCDEFPDSPICQETGRSPKIFCDELLSWEDVTDWSHLENEEKAKANLQGLCSSASGNEKCLGLLLNGSGRLNFNVGSTLSLMGLSMDEIKGQDGTIEIYQTQGIAPESMETDLVGLSFLTTAPGSLVSGMTQLVGGSTLVSETMALTMTWPYEDATGNAALNKFQVKLMMAGEEIVCDVPPVLRALSVAGGESGPTKGLCALIPNGTRGPVDFMAVLLLIGLIGTTTRLAYSRHKRN